MEKSMITQELYEQYLDLLLKGRRAECAGIVLKLLDQHVELKSLYMDLFQRSLYAVGELWELNKISVSREHLATAITESLLNLVYPRLLENTQTGKKVVVSCAANELHQIGGKIVADFFELNGWESHFLGANTPIPEILGYIQETKPDLVGLSLSVYFNMPSLIKEIEAIRSNFKHIDIFLGGQAFRWGGLDLMKKYPATHYIESLSTLEVQIKNHKFPSENKDFRMETN